MKLRQRETDLIVLFGPTLLLPVSLKVPFFYCQCSKRYFSTSATALESTSVPLSVVLKVLLYHCHCSGKYFSTIATALQGISLPLPVVLKVLLYHFHCTVASPFNPIPARWGVVTVMGEPSIAVTARSSSSFSFL